MRELKTARRVSVLLLLFLYPSASTTSAQPRARSLKIQEAPDGDAYVGHSLPPQTELRLFFSNPKLPEWANSCGAGEFVERKVPATKRPADTALRLLFAGPTPEEKARGMEAIAHLGRYYLGVSIRRRVAVVNFRSGAEEHLHVSGPNCQQEQVLTPIVKTLTQFNSIKTVKYAINGKIITEWDA